MNLKPPPLFKKMILLLRGHIRNSFETDNLYNIVYDISTIVDKLEIYIHTWSIKQNAISWREMEEDTTPITEEVIRAYFKDLSYLLKYIIIDDDTTIKLTGNTEGIIYGTRMPLQGWKNYWYGKYRIIEYLYMTQPEEKTVLNTRFDIIDNTSFPLTPLELLTFVKMYQNNHYTSNKFITDMTDGGIDNIYMGSIKTQYELIKHFHENLDAILKKNGRIMNQEFLVYIENKSLFS